VFSPAQWKSFARLFKGIMAQFASEQMSRLGLRYALKALPSLHVIKGRTALMATFADSRKAHKDEGWADLLDLEDIYGSVRQQD